MIYRLFFRLILRRIDAEQAHDRAAALLGWAGRLPPLAGSLRQLLRPHDPSLRVRAFGITFGSPLGVAAGVDKNATWFEGLGSIGFGFVEVGTVTAEPQEGAKKPRIERLKDTDGLLNWMGFPNDGAEAVASRIAHPRKTIVGVNIGKSKRASAEDSTQDYRRATKLLAPFADYLVLNVSSPNTLGQRDMQAADVLRRLVAEVRKELDELDLRMPLLVKIGPDLSDDELDDVADVAIAMDLDGLIAVNTTVKRDGYVSDFLSPTDTAGLSGAPLTRRSLEVLMRLRARVGSQVVLVAVGGVQTPADALDRILAGATLVQAHTGFIYGGPLWPWRVNRTLARAVRQRGAASVQELIGADGPQQAVADENSNGIHVNGPVIVSRGARNLV